MEDDTITSGFVGEDLFPDEHKFSDIREVYSSASGYNRLFRCERHGKLHLLKALQTAYMGSSFHEQALRKEFNIGYQLEHPHICRTVGWEQITGLGNCILLEYIDGITLKDFMEQGKLTSELAYKLLTELCGALQYLHSKQIIHRDLKPSNILITHNGNNVKLIDFSLSDCDDYDVLKIPAGTRYYLAPEALQTNTALDLRADLYSLGVIIGEMTSIVKERKLTAISRKCTQRKPERRYNSANGVVAALERKRYPAYWYVAASVIVVALFFGAIEGFWQSSRQKKTDFIAFPVYGNSSSNEVCRRILLDEQIRLYWQKKNLTANYTTLEEDSVQLLMRLKEALQAQFPLHVQQQSEEYLKQWESLSNEAKLILQSSRTSPNK